MADYALEPSVNLPTQKLSFQAFTSFLKIVVDGMPELGAYPTAATLSHIIRLYSILPMITDGAYCRSTVSFYVMKIHFVLHSLTQGLCVFGASPYSHPDPHIEHQNDGHRDYEEGARGYLPDRKAVATLQHPAKC